MIFVPLYGNPPGDKWLKKAEIATKKLLDAKTSEERQKIIDDNSGLWAEVKQHLLKISHNKCWYSESIERFSHYHVDHFRPKKRAFDLNGEDQGGYWWLAFEWRNYRITGSVGNTKKGDRFCVRDNKCNDPGNSLDDEIFYFLDPTDEDDPLKLSFEADGTAKPASTEMDDWDYKRAKYTIENLDLNYDLLVDGRKDLWTVCADKVNEIQNLMVENNKTPSATKRQRIKLKIDELRKLVHPSAQFSATAKICLLKSGVVWAMRIAS